MRHEPCRLVRDLQGAVQLVGAYAFLRGAHEIDALEPQIQFDVARLKDGAHGDGELAAAVAALFQSGTGLL